MSEYIALLPIISKLMFSVGIGLIWCGIGLLMMRHVWRRYADVTNMIAHNDSGLGTIMFVNGLFFWPYPQWIMIFFLMHDGWVFLRDKWKYRNVPKPPEVRQLTEDEVDALMICIEMYVRWVASQPTPSDLSPETAAKRMVIAQRMADYLRDPRKAVMEMVRMNFSDAPQNWHKK